MPEWHLSLLDCCSAPLQFQAVALSCACHLLGQQAGHLIDSMLTQGGSGPANHCHPVQGIECEQPDQCRQQITAHAAK